MQVRRLFVAGRVRGTVLQAQRVEIAATGKILGDVHTESLVIADGAIFEGRCSMDTKGAKPDVVKPDAAKPDAAKPDAAKPDLAGSGVEKLVQGPKRI